MIVRTDKASREHFVVIDVRPLRDTGLSLRARGLHAYLMTMADNWEVRLGWLLTQFPEGRVAVQSAFRELREHGYAQLRPKYIEGGGVAGTEWVIYETALTSRFPDCQVSRPSENLTIRKPGSPYKKDQSNKKDQSGKEKQSELLLFDDTKEIEAIYNAYPRKVAKRPALKAIRSCLKRHGSKLTAEALLNSVAFFAKSVKATSTEPRFIPYPATWFNEDRWEDNTPSNDRPASKW